MSTIKQQLIQQRLSEPLKVGDSVNVSTSHIINEPKRVGKGRGSKTIIEEKEIKNVLKGTIKEILPFTGDFVIDFAYHSPPYQCKFTRKENYYIIPKSQVVADTYSIGINPFKEKSFWGDIQFSNRDINGLLFYTGWERRKNTFRTESFGDITIPELNWNPVVKDKEGKEVLYQRGFVWNERDKQLLIDSIYNNLEIGKFVFRRRSWKWVEGRVKEGKIEGTAFYDIVDGKQRLNAILGFIQGEYPDSQGNYWDDLSDYSQRLFENFSKLSLGEIGEQATDQDVINTFLNINFTGVQMSEEHINYVKAINKKL